MRRIAAILGAAVCVALALGLLLAALDVARWERALESGDVRYRAAPEEPDLWQPRQSVPFGAAKSLLGVEDDVARWERALESGDVRYRAAPEGPDLWQPRQSVPFGAAKSLLGVEDDVDFREALQTLRLAGIAQAESSDPLLALRRSDARSLIAEIAEGDGDRSRRSRAMTLLGVISFASALSDSQDQESLQRDALARFRGAIELAPDNDEAKANLEIALRRDAEAGESGGGDDPTPGGQGARGAGAGEAGGGY